MSKTIRFNKSNTDSNQGEEILQNVDDLAYLDKKIKKGTFHEKKIVVEADASLNNLDDDCICQ